MNYKHLIIIVFSISFVSFTFCLYTDIDTLQQPMDANEEKGKMLFQEKNCISCHQVYGLGGYLGPDLTNVSSKRSQGYINVFLEKGTNVMPNFHFSDQEIFYISAYLKHLDESGNSDPKQLILNTDGTIEHSK